MRGLDRLAHGAMREIALVAACVYARSTPPMTSHLK